MEQLHGVLSKMIKERQGDQITPELWQHCEESARLYAFVERMLHGSVFVCAGDAHSLPLSSLALTYLLVCRGCTPGARSLA
jgi:hypothetical protein